MFTNRTRKPLVLLDFFRKLRKLKRNVDLLNLIQKAVDLSTEKMDDLDAIHQLGEGWVAEEA